MFYHISEQELFVATDIRGLDVEDRVRAVEVAENIHGFKGDKEDRFGVVRRVPEAEDLPSVHLCRKRLHGPELRILHGATYEKLIGMSREPTCVPGNYLAGQAPPESR